MLFLFAVAAATTLTEVNTETVEAGITLTEYRASSPDTDVWVLRVDLCVSDVYVDATRDSASSQSTGSWAEEVGATAATNGDFYRTDPVRVYGDAYGGGVRWPSGHTGWDSAYVDEWYWEHYGWIAFGHDAVWFSHTGWVKDNISGLSYGVDNTDLTPAPPDGVVALVSGFPELVVEGLVMVCADPEDSDCFPDRSDMRDRHPRTAMGLTEDLSTLILAVADGRTSNNDGLYGSELADIMGQLGAWQAFNLDGGGSSQLWTDGDGYINDYDGNNSGSGARSVANHWGIFAGGRDFLPARPGHCSSEPSCGTLAAAGGVIDDTNACYRGFGDPDYWRSEASGYGGGLRWTNAFEADRADNWAWWRVELAEAGDYEVSVYTSAEFSVFDDVEYQVQAAGVTTNLQVDPSGHEGWLSLRTYTFDAGGEQWVAVFDHYSDSPGSNQHIVADALQLTRVGEWCGDGLCAGSEACSCGDCPVGEEVEANGLDDDCDGEVDELTGGGGTEDSEPADSAPDVDLPPVSEEEVNPGESRSNVEEGPAKAEAAGCGCRAADGAHAGAGFVLAAMFAGRRRRRGA